MLFFSAESGLGRSVHLHYLTSLWGTGKCLELVDEVIAHLSSLHLIILKDITWLGTNEWNSSNARAHWGSQSYSPFHCFMPRWHQQWGCAEGTVNNPYVQGTGYAEFLEEAKITYFFCIWQREVWLPKLHGTTHYKMCCCFCLFIWWQMNKETGMMVLCGWRQSRIALS